MTTVVVREEQELEQVAQAILSTLPTTEGAAVLTLTGDLGAGKTALTKALARVLSVREQVTSPTFVIIKSYPILGHARFTTLTHVDAYRIDDERELVVLGFSELLREPTRLVVVEWPERVKGLLRNVTRAVSITIGEEGERTIVYD